MMSMATAAARPLPLLLRRSAVARRIGHRVVPATHGFFSSSSAWGAADNGRNKASAASLAPVTTSPLSTDTRSTASPSAAAAAAAAMPPTIGTPMTDTATTAAPLVALDPTMSDYATATLELSKARLSALVVVTSTAGFLTAGGPISYPTLAACAAGTALCSSSASTLNQILELERDTKMKRTRHRPLVRGVVTPATAAALAGTTGIGGGSVLLAGTDPVTAALGVGNIALYAGLYTWLKPRSEINTWVGAVVGATPPVMGWTAATGGSLFDLEAALLGGTLFLWQFPHFFALSWMHRVDYARGGFQMVPVNDVDTNGDRTAALINRYTWYMTTIPFVSSALGATSSMFAVEGIVLNAYAIHVARKFDEERTNANARKVFLTSLWYLPCLMTLFILHSRRWRDGNEIEEKGEEDIVAMLRRRVSYVRNKGREMCLHEIAVVKEEAEETGTGKTSKCPITLGKSKVTEATEKGVTVASAVASNGTAAEAAAEK